MTDQRRGFIREWLKQRTTMAALCADFGISRKTGYKFVARFEADGWTGLGDLPRIAEHCPHRTPLNAERAVLRVREAHPTWGGKKIRAYLLARASEFAVPARSTIDGICARHGLVRQRRRPRRRHPIEPELTQAQAPNDVWCADYKGWFRLGSGQRCEPFTMTDAFSRYALRCDAQPGVDLHAARRSCERAFREFGLPRVIRCDNGPPFGARSHGGLTRLVVWWVRLGIRPERIAPGCPQQNGAHERFHRTLKAETTRPPRNSLVGQQRAFTAFCRHYNTERPHAALADAPPATCYEPSPRRYPRQLPQPRYADDVVIRRATRHGCVRWHGQRIFVSQTLRGTDVGLQQAEDGGWTVWFGPLFLGWLNTELGQVQSVQPPMGG